MRHDVDGMRGCGACCASAANPRSRKRANNCNFTNTKWKALLTLTFFLSVEAQSLVSCVVVVAAVEVAVVVGTPSFFCFVWSSPPVVPANFLAKNLTVQSRATGLLPGLRPTFSSLYGFSQLSIAADLFFSPFKNVTRGEIYLKTK